MSLDNCVVLPNSFGVHGTLLSNFILICPGLIVFYGLQIVAAQLILARFLLLKMEHARLV